MPHLYNVRCPTCQAHFSCGSEDGQGCWCNSLPPVSPDPNAVACYCPGCMARKLRLDEKAQDRKPQEGVDYYINEQGYWVFTALYHLKRGRCCGSGCRNCPYGFSPD